MGLFDLTGKQALVTGAGGPEGLGRAMARGLKEAGATVAILSRSEPVFEVAKEDGFIPIQADLTDRADLKRGFDLAVEQLGSLDILVNSHGVQRRHKHTLPAKAALASLPRPWPTTGPAGAST